MLGRRAHRLWRQKELSMLIRSSVALALCLSSAPAFAAANADLVTALTASQSPAPVYQAVRYWVTVSNTGGKPADAVVVDVALPATATSPQVYVYGQLGAVSQGCTRTGTNLRCAVGGVARRNSRAVFFDLALPVSTRTFQLQATASTSSAEQSLTNNGSSLQAQQTYHPTPVNTSVNGAVTMQNHHCTGQGLTGWFECSLFPSAIAMFRTTLLQNGTLTTPDEPGYFGSWSVSTTPAGNQLTFQIQDGSGVAVTFSGWGAGPSCFEGLATFPNNSPYVAPYRVCPQP